MDAVRIYTGPDDLAHFEEIDPVTAEHFTKGFVASHCEVRTMEIGRDMDFHPAPRRLLFVHLSGRLQIGLRDGTVHVFGPSSIRFQDDVGGTGHTTKVLGDEPVVTLAVFVED